MNFVMKKQNGRSKRLTYSDKSNKSANTRLNYEFKNGNERKKSKSIKKQLRKGLLLALTGLVLICLSLELNIISYLKSHWNEIDPLTGFLGWICLVLNIVWNKIIR